MRIAVYQGPGVPRRPDENRRIMATVARESAERGCGLVIFPELFSSGYNIGDKVFDLAEPADGPTADTLAQAAREHRIAILAGYPERADHGVYNAAMLIGPDGALLANARKTHLFGAEEKRLFIPGESLSVACVQGIRIGIIICYDVEFPEAVRALALQGAELVAVPTALMRPFERVARWLVPVRAFENQVFLAYANRCGREGDLEYCGESCIIAPDGSELGRAHQAEDLIVADLDPDAFERSRTDNPYLRDRRPDLYGALVKMPGEDGETP
ncbi:MAG TPA: carbon-nitrogen hydrolase family protein [Arenicellales bacterium]|nr:carbon-nitrogen hydrolase family protein [Arenicellales bacterium]